MNDPEEFLYRLTPRWPESAIQAKIQEAIARELARPRHASWERRLTWLTAAAIVFGIGLNYVAAWVDHERQARWVRFETLPPGLADVTRMVATASDAETGAWVEQQFLQARQRSVARRISSADFEHYIHLILRESYHAPTEEITPVSRSGPGNVDRRGAHRECIFRLAYRQAPGRAVEQAPLGRGAVVSA